MVSGRGSKHLTAWSTSVSLAFLGPQSARAGLSCAEPRNLRLRRAPSAKPPLASSGWSSTWWSARCLLVAAEQPRELPAHLHQKCQEAIAGNALAIDDWLELADVVISSATSLCAEDAVIVLRACERHGVEDPTLYAALADRFQHLALGLQLAHALASLELFLQYRARRDAGRRSQYSELFSSLALRLQVCAVADAQSLVHTLSTLARCSFKDASLVQRLAAATVEVRGLQYHDVVSVILAFDALGVLHGPLSELLEQRRRLMLEAAPVSSLLQALLQVKHAQLPMWLLRSDDAEADLLRAFLMRLEAFRDMGADEFDDPFDCFYFLAESRQMPTSYLRAMCIWARKVLRRGKHASQAPLISARRLCALDNACAARGLESVRPELDAAIRAFIAFSQMREQPTTM